MGGILRRAVEAFRAFLLFLETSSSLLLVGGELDNSCQPTLVAVIIYYYILVF
jgi:hypothetical protein